MILPQDFIVRMHRIIPSEADDFLSAMAQPPAVAIKLNRRKPATSEDILDSFPDDNDLPSPGEMTHVRWCDSGLYLPVRPQFTLNPLMHAGCFYVQDPSSMVYERLAREAITMLGNINAPKILDMCAAPGGKTTSIINAAPDGSLIVANEFNTQRAHILRENLAKWGYHDVIVTNSPTDAFAADPAMFDIVAVDAPCSGEGMMRKDETARSQWSEGLIRQCAALQRDILGNAVKALRPGGVLIYSTCTFNMEENEEMVLSVCNEYGLSPVDLPTDLQNMAHPSLIPDIPALRFMPHVTRGEGLFVAMLRKTDDFPCGISESRPPRRYEKKSDKSQKKKEALPDISSYVTFDSPQTMTVGDTIYLMTPDLADMHRIISRHARVISAGVPAAVAKGRGVMPTAQLALSTACRNGIFPSCEISRDMALNYLRHEALPGMADTPSGYAAVTYKNHPLGFIKNLGTRSNNLYNKDWKIRTL